jgi:YegS/Rv2252/BmrU family lipid kinase
MNYFIVNPISGTFSKKQRAALYDLIASDTNNIIWKTTIENTASKLALKAIEKNATRIIAVGGDGTINEVGSVLIGTSIEMGIIPLGSGNGLARHLQLPLKINEAYERALQGEVIRIDAGLINDQYFFCTAGLGFDALVANRFANRKRRGLYNYIIATIGSLFGYQPIQLKLNGIQKTLFSLSIANANQFGNNAFISPYSNIQDGTLEIVAISKLNLWEAAMISIRLFTKTIGKSSKVDIQSFQEMKIECPNATYLHMDGEALTASSSTLVVKIVPNCLKVIV